MKTFQSLRNVQRATTVALTQSWSFAWMTTNKSKIRFNLKTSVIDSCFPPPDLNHEPFNSFYTGWFVFLTFSGPLLIDTRLRTHRKNDVKMSQNLTLTFCSDLRRARCVTIDDRRQRRGEEEKSIVPTSDSLDSPRKELILDVRGFVRIFWCN